MAKILLNPDKGAAIKDYRSFGVTRFEEKSFEPGSVFQFEDEREADDYLDHFGFLEEISVDNAKRFLAMDKLKCDQCDFQTRVKTELERHIEVHSKEQELSDLGIPVLKKKQTISSLDEKVVDLQKQIDAQDRADGLEGGFTDDKPIKDVIMS